MDPHVPPRVADDRECAAGATTGGTCLFLLGSDSSGLDSCSTDRDSEELSMDLENAFSGESVGLQSFGVVAAVNRRHASCRDVPSISITERSGVLEHSVARIGSPMEMARGDIMIYAYMEDSKPCVLNGEPSMNSELRDGRLSREYHSGSVKSIFVMLKTYNTERTWNDNLLIIGHSGIWVKSNRGHRQAINYSRFFGRSLLFSFFTPPMKIAFHVAFSSSIILSRKIQRMVIDASHIKNTQRVVQRSCSRAKSPFRGHSSFLSSPSGLQYVHAHAFRPYSRQDSYRRHPRGPSVSRLGFHVARKTMIYLVSALDPFRDHRSPY